MYSQLRSMSRISMSTKYLSQQPRTVLLHSSTPRRDVHICQSSIFSFYFQTMVVLNVTYAAETSKYIRYDHSLRKLKKSLISRYSVKKSTKIHASLLAATIFVRATDTSFNGCMYSPYYTKMYIITVRFVFYFVRRECYKERYYVPQLMV